VSVGAYKKNPQPRGGPFGPLYSKETLEIVRRVQRDAAREKIPVALIGGLAMRVLGSPRLTDDIDFAATKLPRFAVGIPLPFGGTRFWLPGGIELNMVVRTDAAAPLFEDAIEKARRTRWGFRIVSPEHLAVMKLEVSREDDVRDLVFLLSEPGLVDRAKLRRLVARFLGKVALRDLNELARKLPRRRPRGGRGRRR